MWLSRWRSPAAAANPVIVGGTGGSGTRAVQELLQALGVFMGSEGVHFNQYRDATDFEPLLDALINPILQHTRRLDYTLDDIPAKLRDQALAQLRRAGEAYETRPQQAMHWGWKNPRSMFLLPLLHDVFPQMCFVHVVRDGRDMAFARNQNQMQKHYEALFGEPATVAPQASLRLWAKANGDARTWAKRVLRRRYRVISFEQLCAAPARESAALALWLGLPAIDAAQAHRIVQSPSSLGRWKEEPQASFLGTIAAEELRVFGYR